MAGAEPSVDPSDAANVAERPSADGSGVVRGATASDAATSLPMVDLSADGDDGEFAEFDVAVPALPSATKGGRLPVEVDSAILTRKPLCLTLSQQKMKAMAAMMGLVIFSGF